MALSFKGARAYKKHNGYANDAVIKKALPALTYSYIIDCGMKLSPLVQKDSHVFAMQKIADLESFNALPVHSSSSGKVVSVSEKRIVIENDMLFEKMPLKKLDKAPSSLTTREKLWIIRESGIYDTVNAVPAHVLLTPEKTPDRVIVCCFDSDPYVSSPQLAALSGPDNILDGLNIAMSILNTKKAVIAVETATRRIFSELKLRIRYNNYIDVISLKSRYPQSERKTLIGTVTGRSAETANSLVIGSETLYNISEAFKYGEPIITKTVTVSGDDILSPSDFRAPIGTPIAALLSDAGYAETCTVIENGIIDGEKIEDINSPVTRGTNAIIAFNNADNIPKYRNA